MISSISSQSRGGGGGGGGGGGTTTTTKSNKIAYAMHIGNVTGGRLQMDTSFVRSCPHYSYCKQ